MCNISLGIEARGEARGIEKTKTEMIINMLKEKVSIDVIAKVAKLPKNISLFISSFTLCLNPCALISLTDIVRLTKQNVA